MVGASGLRRHPPDAQVPRVHGVARDAREGARRVRRQPGHDRVHAAQCARTPLRHRDRRQRSPPTTSRSRRTAACSRCAPGTTTPCRSSATCRSWSQIRQDRRGQLALTGKAGHVDHSSRLAAGRARLRVPRPGAARRALTHRSAGSANNERLEFLGDAVLYFVVAELLFRRVPAADEGELSRFRASLVSGEALAAIAAETRARRAAAAGRGRAEIRRLSPRTDPGGRARGAVRRDLPGRRLGGRRARSSSGCSGPRLDRLPAASELKDPKTRLQESLQARGLPLPSYAVSRSGEAHNQLFQVRCDVADARPAAVASGSSRRRAEQAAAQLILRPCRR